MALEDLTPAVRIEAILDGAAIEPANRLEYFLKQAANEVPKPTVSDAGKVLTVDDEGKYITSYEGDIIALNAVPALASVYKKTEDSIAIFDKANYYPMCCLRGFIYESGNTRIRTHYSICPADRRCRYIKLYRIWAPGESISSLLDIDSQYSTFLAEFDLANYGYVSQSLLSFPNPVLSSANTLRFATEFYDENHNLLYTLYSCQYVLTLDNAGKITITDRKYNISDDGEGAFGYIGMVYIQSIELSKMNTEGTSEQTPTVFAGDNDLYNMTLEPGTYTVFERVNLKNTRLQMQSFIVAAL